MKYLNKAEYKAIAKDAGNPPKDVGLCIPARLKAVDGETPEGNRKITYIATDSGPDREGDIVVSAGVDTTQFSEAGSILFGHRTDDPNLVLGRPSKITKEETRVLVEADFFPAEVNPIADMVFRMVKAGGLSGVSVGLRVLEFTEANDRPGFMPWNILRSELVELSVTPTPMNPRAIVASAREAGVSDAEIARASEEIADLKTMEPKTAKHRASALTYFARGIPLVEGN